MPQVAAVFILCAALCVVLGGFAYLLGAMLGKRGEPFRDWVAGQTRYRKSGQQPAARPIELITADLRRLGSRFHALDPHVSHTKVEAVRSGYDRALAECCAALGITHLLGVLPEGPELDAERTRVERQLTASGVRFRPAA
ncbi:MAG TPA: hypothetical protein PLZ93_24280 [Nocardioides sp.]|uniref:hypothetical protein n=1 Tax=uncultured Nocardioides sp. TaxID=198441 RepID=UPI000EE9B22C|nr:hypothetical protein [uncultured Nocardioides sp.]HCB05312.1 hypothetical protein [Nocardioides sp.]HRD63635.1 hypothetical protein [Nocardioides sp.]HRI98765.1 hypothetical protein [Nocardioides sp.]HRK48619.1 hypothetical protein [Nocardioides sp.]